MSMLVGGSGRGPVILIAFRRGSRGRLVCCFALVEEEAVHQQPRPRCEVPIDLVALELHLVIWSWKERRAEIQLRLRIERPKRYSTRIRQAKRRTFPQVVSEGFCVERCTGSEAGKDEAPLHDFERAGRHAMTSYRLGQAKRAQYRNGAGGIRKFLDDPSYL